MFHILETCVFGLCCTFKLFSSSLHNFHSVLLPFYFILLSIYLAVSDHISVSRPLSCTYSDNSSQTLNTHTPPSVSLSVIGLETDLIVWTCFHKLGRYCSTSGYCISSLLEYISITTRFHQNFISLSTPTMFPFNWISSTPSSPLSSHDGAYTLRLTDNFIFR